MNKKLDFFSTDRFPKEQFTITDSQIKKESDTDPYMAEMGSVNLTSTQNKNFNLQ